ncbi:MAG: TetR/AcrR family transcriptional regulator [Actinobacteria bacterium]|nr:TetR/AcrR family transcriptional regulator [Actinomycetota bacterium]
MENRTRRAALTKGQERLAEVLAAAERLLRDSGPEGFTLRAVADEVGISLGNLQYYFPTRAELLDAVFQRYVQTFRDDIFRILPRHDDPRERLLAIVDYWLGTEHDPEQSLFWHLWAISAHDDSARATMESVYGPFLVRLADMLREIHPRLSKPLALRRAAAITAVIEGSGIFVGFGRSPVPALRTLQREIREVVLMIVDRQPGRDPR